MIISGPAFGKNICKEACNHFIHCTEEINHKKVTAKQKKIGIAGCMNTCKKKYIKVKKCYIKGQKSCTNYASCLTKAAKS